MLAAAGLNAGLFIGGDHEFVILQGAALPLTGIEIQHSTCFGGEIWIPWKNPTAVIRGPESHLPGLHAYDRTRRLPDDRVCVGPQAAHDSVAAVPSDYQQIGGR
jgi:hypothetical protein